ncbi:MAG: hypothetical protein WCJ70_04905 [bacterium]
MSQLEESQLQFPPGTDISSRSTESLDVLQTRLSDLIDKRRSLIEDITKIVSELAQIRTSKSEAEAALRILNQSLTGSMLIDEVDTTRAVITSAKQMIIYHATEINVKINIKKKLESEKNDIVQKIIDLSNLIEAKEEEEMHNQEAAVRLFTEKKAAFDKLYESLTSVDLGHDDLTTKVAQLITLLGEIQQIADLRLVPDYETQLQDLQSKCDTAKTLQVQQDSAKSMGVAHKLADKGQDGLINTLTSLRLDTGNQFALYTEKDKSYVDINGVRCELTPKPDDPAVYTYTTANNETKQLLFTGDKGNQTLAESFKPGNKFGGGVEDISPVITSDGHNTRYGYQVRCGTATFGIGMNGDIFPVFSQYPELTEKKILIGKRTDEPILTVMITGDATEFDLTLTGELTTESRKVFTQYLLYDKVNKCSKAFTDIGMYSETYALTSYITELEQEVKAFFMTKDKIDKVAEAIQSLSHFMNTWDTTVDLPTQDQLKNWIPKREDLLKVTSLQELVGYEEYPRDGTDGAFILSNRTELPADIPGVTYPADAKLHKGVEAAGCMVMRNGKIEFMKHFDYESSTKLIFSKGRERERRRNKLDTQLKNNIVLNQDAASTALGDDIVPPIQIYESATINESDARSICFDQNVLSTPAGHRAQIRALNLNANQVNILKQPKKEIEDIHLDSSSHVFVITEYHPQTAFDYLLKNNFKLCEETKDRLPSDLEKFQARKNLRLANGAETTQAMQIYSHLTEKNKRDFLGHCRRAALVGYIPDIQSQKSNTQNTQCVDCLYVMNNNISITNDGRFKLIDAGFVRCDLLSNPQKAALQKTILERELQEGPAYTIESSTYKIAPWYRDALRLAFKNDYAEHKPNTIMHSRTRVVSTEGPINGFQPVMDLTFGVDGKGTSTDIMPHYLHNCHNDDQYADEMTKIMIDLLTKGGHETLDTTDIQYQGYLGNIHASAKILSLN